MLLNLADARRACGDVKGALTAYDEALAQARRTGNLRDEEGALKARAFVAREEGLLEEAIVGYRGLHALYVGTDQRVEAAKVTVLLEFVEAERGGRLDATRLVRAVEVAYDESSMASARVPALWRSAFALRDEGRLGEALQVAEEAWVSAAQAGDPLLEATSANNVATLLSYAGDAIAARNTLDHALDLLRKADDPACLVISLCTKSGLESTLGNEKAAFDALAEASEISRERLSGTPLEGQVLLALSELESDADASWRLAVRGRALELCDRPGYDRPAVRAMLGFAEAQVGAEDLPAARDTLDSAVLRSRSARIEGEEHSALVARAKLLDRMGLRGEAIEDLKAACAIVERWRGAIDEEDLRRAFFADTVEAHRVLAYWHAEAGDLEAAFQHAELSKTRTLLDAVVEQRSATVSLAEVQAVLSARGAVLLEYVVPTSKPAMVLCVTQEHATAATLGPRFDVADGARKLRDALESNGDPAPAAHALHQLLIAPVAAELDGSELWIAPDGPLDAVPFAMLPEVEPEHLMLSADGKDTELLAAFGAFLRGRARRRNWMRLKPLVHRWTIRMIPSASVALRPRLGPTGDAVVVLAAPLDEHTTAVDGFTPLKAARDEAEAVSALWADTTKVQSLTGKEVTKATVLDLATREPLRLLHVASHSMANDRYPAASALVLGPGRAERLTAGEIARQTIEADLVVLSACETGLGPSTDGEGTMSLARAFLMAGAVEVTFSYWQVDDRPTANLMTQFNRNLVRGMAPHEALRAAQLEILNATPRAWAAFAVLG